MYEKSLAFVSYSINGGDDNMNDFKSPKWRDKNTYKTLKEVSKLVPSTKKDFKDYKTAYIKHCILKILVIPLIILWIPFACIGLLSVWVTTLMNWLETIFCKGLYPLSKQQTYMFDAASKIEHGDGVCGKLKNTFGWEFPTWHYVNRDGNNE